MTIKNSEENSFVEENIRQERIGIIFNQVAPSMAISTIAAFVFIAALWEVTEHSRLLIWLSIILMITTMRFYYIYLYRRTPPADIDIHIWEKRFVLSNFAMIFTWGIGVFFLMPNDSLAHQAIVVSFLVGMTAGIVAIYSAHVMYATSSVIVLMIPITVYLILQNTFLHFVMAFGVILFILSSLRSVKLLTKSLKRSYQSSYELKIAKEGAEYLARTDALTELLNRRAFYEKGDDEVIRSKRYSRTLSLIVLDLDHFKMVNDNHGHVAGDEALIMTAKIILQETRDTDVAGRLGGEEFGICLPETSLKKAAHIAERLRIRISDCAVYSNGKEVKFTTSAGVSGYDENSNSFSDIMDKADKALYIAKNEGRNKVVVYSPSSDPLLHVKLT